MTYSAEPGNRSMCPRSLIALSRVHGQRLDRESLVSALVKKVRRQDRFTRPDKNVFALLKGGQ